MNNLGYTCTRGHVVDGSNAEPRTDAPGKVRCRTCRVVQRALSDKRRRGQLPPLPLSRKQREALDRQILVERYEDILSVHGGTVRDIAVKLDVHFTTLYGALRAVRGEVTSKGQPEQGARG